MAEQIPSYLADLPKTKQTEADAIKAYSPADGAIGNLSNAALETTRDAHDPLRPFLISEETMEKRRRMPADKHQMEELQAAMHGKRTSAKIEAIAAGDECYVKSQKVECKVVRLINSEKALVEVDYGKRGKKKGEVLVANLVKLNKR